jgi:hypothetical protein
VSYSCKNEVNNEGAKLLASVGFFYKLFSKAAARVFYLDDCNRITSIGMPLAQVMASLYFSEGSLSMNAKHLAIATALLAAPLPAVVLLIGTGSAIASNTCAPGLPLGGPLCLKYNCGNTTYAFASGDTSAPAVAMNNAALVGAMVLVQTNSDLNPSMQDTYVACHNGGGVATDGSWLRPAVVTPR